MGISLSPASWLQNLSKNTKERDLKIADHLDQIADEGKSMAKLWEEVIHTILTQGVAVAEPNTLWMRLVERPEWTIYSKTIPRSKLELFYDRVSNVLGKASKGERDFFICKIGAVLEKRRLTKDTLEEELKKIRETRFFDKNNQLKTDMSIKDSISLLDSEVAALSSFAKEFRNKI